MPQKIQILAGADIAETITPYTFAANAAVSLSTMGATIQKTAGAGETHGTQALYAVVSIETNNARFGFNSALVTQARGHLIKFGKTIVLEGFDEISKFVMCPAVAGLYPTIQITTEF